MAAIADPGHEAPVDGDGAEADGVADRVRGHLPRCRPVAVNGVTGDVHPIQLAAFHVPQWTFGELRAGQMVEQTHDASG